MTDKKGDNVWIRLIRWSGHFGPKKMGMIFRRTKEILFYEIGFYQVGWVRWKFVMRKFLCVYKINEPFTNNHKWFIKLTYHPALYKIFVSSPNHAIRTRILENFWSREIAHCVQIGLDIKCNEFIKFYVTVKTPL
jgi:hypothetical protein